MTDLRDQLASSFGTTYAIERELGGGGMSRVFLADESALGRKVVVKVLSPDLAAGVSAERFTREVRLSAQLQHANIVPLLAAGESGGLPWYTMPFVDGASLRERLAAGPLPVPEVVAILRDVARALAYAHARGVVHRDIKPENVLLSGGAAIVSDFGIAKAISAARDERGNGATAALTQLGFSLGTPRYMAPEQGAGDPHTDHRADLYSFGCVAYELLTGRPPFTGDSPQKLLVAHLTEAVVPLSERRPDTPPALARLVMRCLEKDPDRRPQSADEIVAALDTVTSAEVASVAGLFARQPRSPVAAIGTYVAAAALVALLARAAVVAFGLPDWTFEGVVALLVAGLPFAAGAVLRANRVVTWARAVAGTAAAVGAFALLVVAVLVLRGLGIGPAASLLAAGKLQTQSRVLVADIGAGADSSLAHVATEAVRAGLAQSSVISLMPPAAVAAALQRMQRPPGSRVDLALAHDVAVREGAKAIVAGDVSPLGAGYVVSLRLVAADSLGDLAAFRATVDGPRELLGAIDRLTRQLRGRIGESLKAVRDAPPLEQVTTPSLDALRLYAEGSRAADLSGDYGRAAGLLREAVARDSAFAMAYRKLGVALSNLGMPRPQVDSALSSAYRFRDRLTERERLLATATYFDIGPGHDRRRAVDAYERVLALDPADAAATNNLGNLLRGRRDFARAEALYRAAIAAGRGSQVAYGNLALTLIDEGKLAAAESVSRDMSQRFPTAISTQTLPARILYQRGQLDSVVALYARLSASANPVVRVSALANLGNLALMRGQLVASRRYTDQAAALNAARGVPRGPISEALGAAAVQIWFLEQPDAGVRLLDSALAQKSTRQIPFEQRFDGALAIWYARAGRADRARAILTRYLADAPDSAYRALLEPTRHGVLAEIALAEHQPLAALAEFRRADTLPDGPVGACGECVYVSLGRAFDLANMPDSTITAYEHYLGTHFSTRDAYEAPFLAGIHKRLGELYDAKNDTARAEAHYAQFVTLWKNADPPLQPKVAEVERRLERLRATAAR